jgi:endonuclease YncB( thermonuclease family)
MRSPLWLLFLCLPAYADTVGGKIVAVVNGDTIELASSPKYRVRLAGIDAPEKNQSFGLSAAHHLAELALGKTARAECYKGEHDGLRICRVYVDEKDLALAQLDAGLAWWFQHYPREQSTVEASRYLIAEARASRKSLGLWQEAKPVAPWIWRKKESELVQEAAQLSEKQSGQESGVWLML